MKLKIFYQPRDIALFLLLAFLCYQAHQWVRHLSGAALCGGWGTVTFTVATTKQPCGFPTLVTLSGPLLTYGLAWVGMFLLRSPTYARFAYTLIFASFAHLRFIQTLTGRGDELLLAEHWFGVTSRLWVAVAVLLIGLPPVVAAFQAMANPARCRTFIVSWLLPLPLLFVLLVSDEWLFRTTTLGMYLGARWGIWLTVLLTDLMASALFIGWGFRRYRQFDIDV